MRHVYKGNTQVISRGLVQRSDTERSVSNSWLSDRSAHEAGTRRRSRPQLSVVVPVFNEEDVLVIAHERLRSVLDNLDLPYEIVFVDDGSSDDSENCLRQLASVSDSVRVARLSRNFGKEAAMTAGLKVARGEAVIVIDADMQDPPELIPAMVAAWQSGVDVVTMRRRSRSGENWIKRSSAHAFYRVLSRLSALSIPEDTGDFRLLSRRAVEALGQLPERNRYMKGLFAWIGLPTQVILYDRDPRVAGHSKLCTRRLMTLAVEAVTSFSVTPLRWLSGIGLLTAAGSAGFGLWILLKTLLLGDQVAGYPSLMTIMAFLGGIQLLSIGLVGEYVGKIYLEVKERPVYLIQELFDGASERPVQVAQTQVRDIAAQG